ncbi:hypothetical protein [Spiroplasma endosymbiont of Diplazon laetatorius]|uniref:hypothetical protein n=1 Tax=Spiroplasma endosymbiont of Diplazon laetatorius TaxID=3066322 RepID=UPI0030D5D634
MDGPTFIVFYLLFYKGATFKKFRYTPLFFAFLQQKLGESAFRHDSRGKYFDTVEFIDPRLKKQITRSNSTADRLIDKCHRVFRKLILKEFWIVQLLYMKRWEELIL